MYRKKEHLKLSDLEKNPDMLINTDQLKALLGVSNPTLYRWRRDNVLKCYKIGGTFKYMASDILKYLEEGRIEKELVVKEKITVSEDGLSLCGHILSCAEQKGYTEIRDILELLCESTIELLSAKCIELNMPLKAATIAYCTGLMEAAGVNASDCKQKEG